MERFSLGIGIESSGAPSPPLSWILRPSFPYPILSHIFLSRELFDPLPLFLSPLFFCEFEGGGRSRGTVSCSDPTLLRHRSLSLPSPFSPSPSLSPPSLFFLYLTPLFLFLFLSFSFLFHVPFPLPFPFPASLPRVPPPPLLPSLPPPFLFLSLFVILYNIFTFPFPFLGGSVS